MITILTVELDNIAKKDDVNLCQFLDVLHIAPDGQKIISNNETKANVIHSINKYLKDRRNRGDLSDKFVEELTEFFDKTINIM